MFKKYLPVSLLHSSVARFYGAVGNVTTHGPLTSTAGVSSSSVHAGFLSRRNLRKAVGVFLGNSLFSPAVASPPHHHTTMMLASLKQLFVFNDDLVTEPPTEGNCLPLNMY